MYKILIAGELDIITERLIKNLGACHVIYTCRTGIDALNILNTVRPEILIIDLMISHIDGLTLLKRSIHKPPVILALTCYLSYEVECLAEAAGIDCLVLLPVSISKIQSNLDSLIERKLQNKIPFQDT